MEKISRSDCPICLEVNKHSTASFVLITQVLLNFYLVFARFFLQSLSFIDVLDYFLFEMSRDDLMSEDRR